MSFLSFHSADTDGSSTDTLVIPTFVTSGSNRHVDVVTGIHNTTATAVSSVARGSETYTKQRGEFNPTGSGWAQAEFWMSTTQPQTGTAAMTVVLAAALLNWGVSATVLDDVDQTTRLRGGVVTLNPDGDVAVDALVYTSAVGDLVISALSVSNDNTTIVPTGGTETLRGSWTTGTSAAKGYIATAPGAASVTLDWTDTTWRFVHYAASHPPSAAVPDVPTNLAAVNVGGTQIGLSWTPPTPSEATSYKIERKVGAGAYSDLVADTGSTATTYLDIGLTANTLYTYRVSGINGSGTGAASTEDAATTPTALLFNITLPTDLSEFTGTPTGAGNSLAQCHSRHQRQSWAAAYDGGEHQYLRLLHVAGAVGVWQ